MKYAVEMGSDAVIRRSVQAFRSLYVQTQTARRSHQPTFIFFKIKKVG
jgi:hypothetical protein